MFIKHVNLLLSEIIGPRLKTAGPIISPLCVRPPVRPSVRSGISQKPLQGFFWNLVWSWGSIGAQTSHGRFFLIFALLRGYPPSQKVKNPKFYVILGFLGLWEKTVPRIFLNFPKMCQKMVLTFWQNFRQIYRLVLELSTKNRKPNSENFWKYYRKLVFLCFI